MTGRVWMAQKMQNRCPHQQPGGFLGRSLSSTWSLAHGVGAQNDGGSSVLLDFRSSGRCRRPGRIVLSVATAQFTRGSEPQAGPGDEWVDADSDDRTASPRPQKSGASRFGVDGGSWFVEPGLFSPGFFASVDRTAE
jgi:hypothetical protein